MKGIVINRGTKDKPRWYIRYELDREASGGKRRQKWESGFSTRKAAEAALSKQLHGMNTGAYVEPSRLTLAAYLRAWLEGAESNLAGKTFERYSQIVENDIIPQIGGVALHRLQPLQIEKYYAERLRTGRKRNGKGLSERTVLHHHRVLHRALAKAVMSGILAANPADRVEPPSPKRSRVEVIDVNAARELIEKSVGSRLRVPIMLAIWTGMRRGEILALRWADVDFINETAEVKRAVEYTKKHGIVFKSPKSESGLRVIALPRILVSELIGHRKAQDECRDLLGSAYEENDLIACSVDGSPWKPPAFDSLYRKLLKRLKMSGPTFHGLRHSHASILHRSGIDAKSISERLGHSKVGFTLDQYVKIFPDTRRDAASRIDDAFEASTADHARIQ